MSKSDKPSWKRKVRVLEERLGRKPTLEELREEVKGYGMTPEEVEEQRQSWARQDMD